MERKGESFWARHYKLLNQGRHPRIAVLLTKVECAKKKMAYMHIEATETDLTNIWPKAGRERDQNRNGQQSSSMVAAHQLK